MANRSTSFSYLLSLSFLSLGLRSIRYGDLLLVYYVQAGCGGKKIEGLLIGFTGTHTYRSLEEQSMGGDGIRRAACARDEDERSAVELQSVAVLWLGDGVGMLLVLFGVLK